MENIERLEPRAFTKFCMSIGMVPSSYTSALTYEEQLLWFCSYLEHEVIPAVNNNAEAVTELQGLYTQLKDYVDHYFDNLDVQDEINNKLDEMVEDGTFDRLLDDFINGEISFNWAPIANQELTNTEAGNCCYIKIKDKIMVIDTMMREDNFNKVAENMIADGITKIDYFIISHLDYDHYGNLGLFVQQFDCSQCLFLLPRVPNNATLHDDYQTAYNNIISTLQSNNITNYRFADNETLQIENIDVRLFNASVEDLNYYDNLNTEYNNYSICTEFDYKDKKVLFCGDLMEEGQKHVAEENYINSNYDLMQDCHHSITVYNELFIKKVHPKNVVAPLSKGMWNKDSYKYTPTLNYYSSYGADIYMLGYQEEKIEFKLNCYGVNLESKSIDYSGIKVGMYGKSFYVDGTTTDTLHIGTEEHPFQTIKEAVSLISKTAPIRPNIYILNVNENEINDTIDVRFCEDWSIFGNNNVLPNFNIFRCNIHFLNCKFNNTDDDYALNIYWSNVTLNNTESTSNSTYFLRGEYSNIYVLGTLKLSNKSNCFNVYNSSKLTIDTSTTTLTDITKFINGITCTIVIRPTPLAYLKTTLAPTSIISTSDYKQNVVSENMKDLYTLFSGTQSNFASITLQDSVANYDYVEIYFRGKYVSNNYTKIPKAEYNEFTLKGTHIRGGLEQLIESNTIASLSGTTITASRSVNYGINNNNTISDYSTTNEIIITRIVGIP